MIVDQNGNLAVIALLSCICDRHEYMIDIHVKNVVKVISITMIVRFRVHAINQVDIVDQFNDSLAVIDQVTSLQSENTVQDLYSC